MRLSRTLRLRAQRQRLLLRGWVRQRELTPVADRTAAIRRSTILLFSTLRNERIRLPYWLDYYRRLGVGHFLIVENGSDDGSRPWLAEQPDVSLWSTRASYRRARFGTDWINGLMHRFGQGHWCLMVDADEFLVYPFCDSRPLGALTDWLDSSALRSFGAMLLDMYPRGRLDAQPYREGEDPFRAACWFDSGNYTFKRNPLHGDLWIQGGPRARAFFAETPARAPALNKIPLVKWRRGYVFASSCHQLLPRGLNLVYDEWGGEKSSGCLLHAKFLDTFGTRAAEEAQRREHYAASHEYRAYLRDLEASAGLWNRWSERYLNWRQLEMLGLMSRGNWA